MDFISTLSSLRYPLAFVSAFTLAMYLTPIIRRGALEYGVVDVPDGLLKNHASPVAYLGGVSIYLSFLCALAFSYEFERSVLGILFASSIVVMLGLFDDLKVLTPSLKLVGQSIAALVLIKADVYIQLSFLPEFVAMALTVVWLVGMTNAINLIDVSDGLAAGVSSVAGAFLYIISLANGNDTIAMMTLCLVGATLGFLRYNINPASIYLGDTGSMFLGFMLGALAMQGHYTMHHRLAAIAPVVILGVPIFDTFFIMFIRALRGLPLMQGSPDHFAVRLRNHGYPAGVIATLAYAAGTLLGVMALGMILCSVWIASTLLLIVSLGALAIVGLLCRMGRHPSGRV